MPLFLKQRQKIAIVVPLFSKQLQKIAIVVPLFSKQQQKVAIVLTTTKSIGPLIFNKTTIVYRTGIEKFKYGTVPYKYRKYYYLIN